jgi:putative ABC transport system permease protein
LLRPTPSRVLRLIAAVLVGAVLYQLILVGALRAGLPAEDLNGVTALTLLAAVAVQRTLGSVTTTLQRLRRAAGLSFGTGATTVAAPPADDETRARA